MRFDDTNDVRQDLLDWSEPIVGDRVADAYIACFGGRDDFCKPMSRQHARLWRMIIGGDKRRAAETRRDLLRLARACHLGPEAIDQIDSLVLDELVDVIARRFQGSAMATRQYSKVLLEAAATLTESRFAVA